MREIIAVVVEELNVKIENRVISSDHIHIFANIPPHIKVSEFVQKAKGRSSKKIQEEFPILRKKYWGRHLWVVREYFSATSGNVTDDMINEYINRHTDAHEPVMTTNINFLTCKCLVRKKASVNLG
ncbi:transposase IS200-family protein [Rickettsia canadensis str. McKiel]|uniref:Transposase IS200-family protein n=1 Tax=Rickettsia canadensis (strain McKiel) TaxID=293613 RepID=A8EYI7_RICCK|nr:transposase IS200-family protein [Rickettsia canadensis str. McKiel]